MRLPALLITALLTGACAATPTNEPRSARAQQQLDRYLTGKVAGAPRTCLPRYSADDMVVVDDNTILFRDGRRVWRTEMLGGCSGLSRAGSALLTRQFGSGELCRGEIARVIDTSAGFTAGSCSFGDFVPYSPPDRP